MKFFIFILVWSLSFFHQTLTCFDDDEKMNYVLTDELIDVIIPATDKDWETLEYCIEGIKKNCNHLGRIIVVSDKRMTYNAEWFNEANYPFTKDEVAWYLNRLNPKETENYLNAPNSRVGWYFQQLLKFYALFVIPDISPNVLILDSDTVFLKPVDFITNECCGNYATGSEFHSPYFNHANKLLPGLVKLYSDKSGICHHMLFQRAIMKDLFSQVEEFHQLEFWKIFCLCVDPIYLNGSGASEYEIYFNFAFSRTNQAKLRPLYWVNSNNIRLINNHRDQGFDYVSYHAYLRI